MNSRVKGCFWALTSGLCFGIIPVLILILSQNALVENSMCLFIRSLIGGICLLPFVFKRVNKIKKPECFSLKLLTASILMSSTSILLFSAYDYLPSGVVISLHYLYPFMVMLLGVVLLHAKIKSSNIISVVLVIGGVMLLCDRVILPADPGKGILLAVGSAAAFAVYLTFMVKSGLSKIDTFVYTGLLCMCDAACLLVFNIAIGHCHMRLTPAAAVELLVVGLLYLLALVAQALALRHVGSVITSILSALEPVICTAGTALFLKDRVSERSLFGMTLILAAVVLVTYGTGENAVSNRE